MHGNRPLALAVGAIVCAAGALAPLPVVLSVVLAVPLVLVLPGFGLLEALGGSLLGRTQRLVLVPASSIALVITVALLLNLFPPGLTIRSWSFALCAVVVVEAAIAYVREPGSRRPRDPERFRVRRLDVVALVVAAAVVAGSVILVKTPLAAKQAVGYTALSIERRSGSRVEVVVQSGELSAKTYRLEIRAAGRLVYRKSERLSPGTRLSQLVKIGPPAPEVSATLYLGARPQVYRRVYLR